MWDGASNQYQSRRNTINFSGWGGGGGGGRDAEASSRTSYTAHFYTISLSCMTFPPLSVFKAHSGKESEISLNFYG